MGSIGAVISKDGESETRLRRALARSPHRGTFVGTAPAGEISIGALATPRSQAHVYRGSGWSVAVSGAIDAVAGIDAPVDPAEAIAQELDRAGPMALSEVRGDFTCVATDGRRLVAARDHLGTDGLFVGSNGSVGAVLSEPKQVVESLDRFRRPDFDGLVSVYFSQWEAADDVPSVVEGVDRVPRAAIIEVGHGGWRRIGRVWDPAAVLETSRLTAAEAVEAGWWVIKKAVDKMTSDRTAIGLSGGIDSTLIAAAAAAGRDGPLGAVSALYPHAPSVDETAYIEATAKALDIDVTSYVPTRDHLDRLDMWVDLIDGPTHGLLIGSVAEMNDVAAGAGYDTLLGGELAELVYDMREYALAGMVARGRLGAVARHVRGLRARGISASSIIRLVVAGLVPSWAGEAYTRRFRRAPDPATWLVRSFMTGLDRHWAMERRPGRRWADIQLFFATGPSYAGLEIAAVMGDVAGVRTRRPLADRDVWEFFLSLPPETKFPDAHTKSLVRMILDGRAPREVVWRTDKTVFNEDSLSRAEYPFLFERLSDGFRLPGVKYQELIRSLEHGSMTMWELSMARNLASIHSFVAVSS